MTGVSVRRAALSLCLLAFSLTTVGVVPAQTVPAQASRPLITDFEGSKTLETASTLSWMVIADEQFGGTSEARPTVIHPGANGSRGALRISFRLTSEFPTPFASVWALIGPEGEPIDLSAYRGVRFYARSTGGKPVAAGVVRYAGQVQRYLKSFETKPEWTLVELPFDQFRQMMMPGAAGEAPALVPTGITSIGITTSPQQAGEFDLDIDHVELYR